MLNNILREETIRDSRPLVRTNKPMSRNQDRFRGGEYDDYEDWAGDYDDYSDYSDYSDNSD